MTNAVVASDHSAHTATGTLLRTKLFIPQVRHLQGLLPRARLVKQLQQGLTRKLTLISAPAGYGKTILLTEWIPQSERCVCWLSLDETDNDLARFLTYVIAALQMLKTDFGPTILLSLQSPQQPALEGLMTALVNEITQTLPDFALVLDDYHLIEQQAIHTALAFLLNHLPPNMHLILTSRADPPLPLARLRVRGQMTELRAADLRFTLNEATAFFHQIKALPLTTEQIKELDMRTEGWGAGLHLAALSLHGLDSAHMAHFIDDFTGSHRDVFDYLVEEVLQQQPPEIYRFLLHSSILGRLCEPLCDAILHSEAAEQEKSRDVPHPAIPLSRHSPTSSRDILTYLEHANLFLVSLDGRRHWYRYHHLFAELLYTRLEQAYPQRVLDLHRRASTWYGQQGLWDEAVQHALAADALEQAADLIESMGLMMLSLGSIQHSLHKWLALLPVDFVRARPKISLTYAWLLLHHWEPAAALQRVDEAEAALAQLGNDGSATQNIRGEIIATRQLITTLSGHFDPAQMNAWGQEALLYLHPDNASYRGVVFGTLGTLAMHQGELMRAEQGFAEMASLGRAAGDLYVALAATGHQVNMQRARGALALAMATCQQAIAWMSQRDAETSPLIGGVYANLADLLRERNDLDTALHYATQAIERATQGANLFLIVSSYLTLVRIKQAQGHLDTAFALIQQVRQLVEQHQFPWVLTLLPAIETQLHLRQGNLPAALSWSPAQDWQKKLVHNSHAFIYAYEYGTITQAQVLLAQGQAAADQNLLGAVVVQLEQQYQAGQTAKLPWLQIKAAALQALAYHALGDLDAALASLARALLLARPEGYVRIFVDEGAPMAALLDQAHRAGLMPEYTSQLLTACAFQPARADDGLGNLQGGFDLTNKPTSKADADTPSSDNNMPGETHQPANSQQENLVESLSKRELEILFWLAQGLTNPEIAQQLYIAEQTVKVHTRNIYGKLGVNSRRQAALKARTLGLLSSLHDGA